MGLAWARGAIIHRAQHRALRPWWDCRIAAVETCHAVAPIAARLASWPGEAISAALNEEVNSAFRAIWYLVQGLGAKDVLLAWSTFKRLVGAGDEAGEDARAASLAEALKRRKEALVLANGQVRPPVPPLGSWLKQDEPTKALNEAKASRET